VRVRSFFTADQRLLGLSLSKVPPIKHEYRISGRGFQHFQPSELRVACCSFDEPAGGSDFGYGRNGTATAARVEVQLLGAVRNIGEAGAIGREMSESDRLVGLAIRVGWSSCTTRGSWQGVTTPRPLCTKGAEMAQSPRAHRLLRYFGRTF
jgi:hypothetical protein